MPVIPRGLVLAAFWLLLATTTVLSLLPATVPMPTTGWDKANHALGFALLGYLGVRCWPARAWKVIVALALYGGCIELAQGLTATRRGEWMDVAADSAGVALGWWASRKLAK